VLLEEGLERVEEGHAALVEHGLARPHERPYCLTCLTMIWSLILS
jgi:hypothetical protein